MRYCPRLQRANGTTSSLRHALSVLSCIPQGFDVRDRISAASKRDQRPATSFPFVYRPKIPRYLEGYTRRSRGATAPVHLVPQKTPRTPGPHQTNPLSCHARKVPRHSRASRIQCAGGGKLAPLHLSDKQERRRHSLLLHHGLLAERQDLHLEVLRTEALSRERDPDGVFRVLRRSDHEAVGGELRHLAGANRGLDLGTSECPQDTRQLVLGPRATGRQQVRHRLNLKNALPAGILERRSR